MENKKLNLAGIFPPIPTAFDRNGNLDLKQVENNIHFFNKFDLQGYVALGSNGEFVLLEEDEKISLIKSIRKTMPEAKPLIAGTGCQSTIATIRLTKAASDAGADAALVLTPSYYKGKMTDAALYEFFVKVSEASPIPIILYNIPSCTGIDLSADFVVSLSNHPNIIGLKDSGGNITKMGEIIHRVPQNFQVLAGSAGFLFPALSIGAVGGILALANIAPEKCIHIQKLFLDGKWEDAKKLQTSLITLNSAITRIGSVPGLKSAMDYLGLYGGPVRGPLLPVSTEEELKIRKLINDAGIGLTAAQK